MGLTGKVAVVTGASRGLGRRIAWALADAGASVVVTGRAPVPGADDPLARVAADIVEAGGTAQAVHCDASREDEVGVLVERTLQRWGRIDVLVNNAAIRLSAKLLDTSPAELEDIIRVNVVGPFLLWRHAVPAMIAQGAGNVITMVSTNAAQQPFVGMAPYRMTKVAVTYLTTDLALEVSGDGVAVNAFDPGPVVSDGTARIRQERQERYGIVIPYHEQDPVDVLDQPIVWLASRRAEEFTGQFVRRTEFGRTWGPGAQTDQKEDH